MFGSKNLHQRTLYCLSFSYTPGSSSNKFHPQLPFNPLSDQHLKLGLINQFSLTVSKEMDREQYGECGYWSLGCRGLILQPVWFFSLFIYLSFWVFTALYTVRNPLILSLWFLIEHKMPQEINSIYQHDKQNQQNKHAPCVFWSKANLSFMKSLIPWHEC